MLRQTLTLYSESSYNAEGREVVGSGTDYSCRFQASSKQRLLPNGSIVSIDAVAYVMPDVDIEFDDHVEFDGTRYKVLGTYKTPGGDGQTKFIKLELALWQET